MLELARLLCPQHGKYAVWIAFFDGEEAVNPAWQDPDNRYGSRQMAAKFRRGGRHPEDQKPSCSRISSAVVICTSSERAIQPSG